MEVIIATFLDVVAALGVLTASNDDIKLVETRTNDCEITRIVTCLPAEITRDIACIPSILKRV